MLSITNFLREHTSSWIESVRKQRLFQISPLAWSGISALCMILFFVLIPIFNKFNYGILILLSLLTVVLVFMCYFGIAYIIAFPIKEKFISKIISYYISTIILFSHIYMLIYIFVPISFKNISTINFNTYTPYYNIFCTYVDCFHFSVVTTTTLGYGDITPDVPLTKLLSDLQVLLGVAILAICLGNYFAKDTEQT